MKRNLKQNPESEWFGETHVTPKEKTSLVHGVFDSVAGNYDLMNDLMSGGLHRLWKDRFARMIRPQADMSFLDVAGGTGDIAFRIRKKTGKSAKITICDLTHHMLSTGRDRAIDRGFFGGFDWVCGNAEDLPLPDETYDIYTIAFGLRNVTHIDKALKEAHRVLKPGGRFFCLEFSQVKDPFLGQLYDTYSYKLIPKIGAIVTKDRDSYQYLIESIRKFPSQKQLAARMMAAGFENVKFTNLSAGIVAIHQGLKT